MRKKEKKFRVIAAIKRANAYLRCIDGLIDYL